MKRLARAGLALFTAVLLVGCGGGEETPAARPTNTPPAGVAVPVPTRPAAFEDYPQVIATYLSEAGDAVLGPPCLAGLLAAWSMPEPDTSFGTEERCRVGNTDADDDEVATLLTAEPEEVGQVGLLSSVVVFDRTDAGYRVAFESWAAGDYPGLVPHTIIAAEDVTGDGAGELVFTFTTCGASTCTLAVHVLTGEGSAYRELTPEGGITMTFADLAIEDRDGDGVRELTLHGGTFGSAGAGPQRARTEVYTWSGGLYALIDTTYEASNLRYFKVVDADAALAEGAYVEAAGLYQQAVSDDLEDIEYFGSREELLAYVDFRLGLAELQLGRTVDASQAIEVGISRYPVSMMGKAAVAFRNTISLSQAGYSGELSDGCAAVTASLRKDAARFEEAWRYGYANPQLAIDQVCPF